MNIHHKVPSKLTNSTQIKLVSSAHQNHQPYHEPKQNLTNSNHRMHTFTNNNKPAESNNSIQLQLQLRQAKSSIQFLKQANNQLLHKISFYERKFEDVRNLEQELEFRRDQQKAMQSHLDNYQQLNGKLRQRINQLQTQLRNKDSMKKVSRTTCQDSTSHQLSRQLSKKSYLNESKIESNRKSVGESQKQNHPLTPKSRVSFNFDQYASKQIESMHLIKERRKVFL